MIIMNRIALLLCGRGWLPASTRYRRGSIRLWPYVERVRAESTFLPKSVSIALGLAPRVRMRETV